VRICSGLLSPTSGMHQHTAYLACRIAQPGHDAHLVTTRGLAADRCASDVQLHAPQSLSELADRTWMIQADAVSPFFRPRFAQPPWSASQLPSICIVRRATRQMMVELGVRFRGWQRTFSSRLQTAAHGLFQTQVAEGPQSAVVLAAPAA